MLDERLGKLVTDVERLSAQRVLVHHESGRSFGRLEKRDSFEFSLLSRGTPTVVQSPFILIIIDPFPVDIFHFFVESAIENLTS